MIDVNRSAHVLERLENRSHLIQDNLPKRKILFATDLSPSSRAGLKWASELARTMKAEILVVHVEDQLTPGKDVVYEVYRRDLATAQARMRAMEVADPNIPCRQKLLTGDPVKEILWLASHENVDLIVMGTHDRTYLSRFFSGSVAEKVLRSAQCPVFVFRQGDQRVTKHSIL